MKNIAAALVKAQRAFGPALKTASNPHFKSKYADLSACVEAVIDGLNENGIFLMQSQHESENGVTVETVFLHESGEMLSAGKLHVPAAKQDPQGYGSALTYARRYSLMAACGIAPEDDDGNAASAKPKVTAVRNDPPPGSGASAKADAYKALAPDWQVVVDDLAHEMCNLVASGSPAGALERMREVQAANGDGWDGEVTLALWSRLPSNVRTPLDRLTKGQTPRAA